MAKLSAHGRELARFEKASETVRNLISVRSDGAIMTQMKFWETPMYSKAGWHDCGWKLHRRGSQRTGTDEALAQSLLDAGWSKTA